LFLANSDLSERFTKCDELKQPDQLTFYASGGKGYADHAGAQEISARVIDKGIAIKVSLAARN
jgi:hypothetical protein